MDLFSKDEYESKEKIESLEKDIVIHDSDVKDEKREVIEKKCFLDSILCDIVNCKKFNCPEKGEGEYCIVVGFKNIVCEPFDCGRKICVKKKERDFVCNNKPHPRGDCFDYEIKMNPETRDLRAWCKKTKEFCGNIKEVEKHV